MHLPRQIAELILDKDSALLKAQLTRPSPAPWPDSDTQLAAPRGAENTDVNDWERQRPSPASVFAGEGIEDSSPECKCPTCRSSALGHHSGAHEQIAFYCLLHGRHGSMPSASSFAFASDDCAAGGAGVRYSRSLGRLQLGFEAGAGEDQLRVIEPGDRPSHRQHGRCRAHRVPRVPP